MNNFLKRNEAIIDVIKYFVVPVLAAAAFFMLDGRYVSKTDWTAAIKDQKTMSVELATEQKQSLNKLTDAITGLANESRSTAELQRANSVAINNIVFRLDKWETLQSTKWDRLDLSLKEMDKRIDGIEIITSRHTEALSRVSRGQ